MMPVGPIFHAIQFIEENGMVEGGHHKQWVIDQVLRILLQRHYETWVATYNMLEDQDDWDVGIAP